MFRQNDLNELSYPCFLADKSQNGEQHSMGLFDNTAVPGEYNTAINVIGGLRDSSLIFKAIGTYFSQSDSLKGLVKERNEFDLRTERSRVRIEHEIKKSFLQFVNEDHRQLIKEVFSERVPIQDKELVLFWQFALNNRLFREITSGVFMEIYYSGRASISKDDIAAYLKEFLLQNESTQISWSENTINTLSTKYLNLMSKLGFVSTGRVKSFRHIRPSSEAHVLFLYFAKLFSPDARDILTNDLLSISFISSEDIQDRLKKLSLKGFFNMNFNGVALNIELTKSYKGVCDDLYN